ncbi:MAG: DUF1704 domain-containing protein [Burkholderiales bacterium]|nr:DUF1704 domain-containing protein [Nitrosomonas sp.]MCP5274445.1 DUF1704 domain-containing protein [Burkholderiales bacterium]
MKQRPLDGDAITVICEKIVRNEPVRLSLQDGGRVHIDRQLPFLCLYRIPRETDNGTVRLILGEAAYLVMPGNPDLDAVYKQLLKTIAEAQCKAFGAFLILEIWSDEAGFDQDSPGQPGFRIFSPVHYPPARLLEELESKLLEHEMAGLKPVVRVTYQHEWSPKSMRCLFSIDELRHMQTIVLGLQIRPIYRDQDSGTLFPFELKQLHSGLAHDLKQVFYSFAHNYTRQRPAHYQELGPRAMVKAVWETDQALAEISTNFDLLLHVSPINVPEAWVQFKSSCYKHEPDFLYRARPFDPGLLKRRLYSIPVERINDPTMAHIFLAKREELDRQINLVADRNTSRFLLGSRALYGDIEPPLLTLAKEMLARIDVDSGSTDGEVLTADAFAERAREEVAYYKRQNSELRTEVVIRSDVPGIMVSKGNFLIGRDTAITVERVRATLAHEIGTHVVTHFNGKQQPFQELHAGMAGYEAMQEGMAVLAEYLVGGLHAARLRLLAGRVVAASMIIEGADFIHTFNTLRCNYGFPDYSAYTITMRIYRGGGFIKDVVYMRGLLHILDYLGKGNSIEKLYLGKLSYEHLPLVEELQWRKIVKPATLLPRFLQEEDACQRLKQVQQGLTVFDMIREAV